MLSVQKMSTRSASLRISGLTAALYLGIVPPATAAISARLTSGPCLEGHTTATVTVNADVDYIDSIEVTLYERDRMSRNDKIASQTQPVGNRGKNQLTFSFKVSRKNIKEVGKTLELFAEVAAKKPVGSRLPGGSEKTKTNVVKIQCK